MMGKRDMLKALADLRTYDMELADTDYKSGYLDALADMMTWLDDHWDELQ